jgi:hypothetical protein
LLLIFLAVGIFTGCAKKNVITLSGSGDFGQKLTGALASCPPSVACFIDARQLTGAQTSAQSILLNRASTTIQVAFSSLTLAPSANIQLTANYVTLEGPSVSASAIKCQAGNAPCIYIGSPSEPGVYSPTLRDLAILPVDGASNASGIVVENARGPGALLERLNVTGFINNSALRVLENSWTWDVRDSSFTNSLHGIEFYGDQPNAWVFQHNLINTNLAEGVFMRLCDYPSSYGGCTSNGMFFEDGNHFEGNGVAGIRLVNGSFFNLVIRDSYAELTKANIGYMLAQNDGTLNGQLRVSGMLVSGGGGYVNGGVPLNILDGTKGIRYGEEPIPIASITCSSGNCTVVTSKPHGFVCSLINGYSLCPYVYLKGTNQLTTKITAVQNPTQFTFFLNGTYNVSKGTVEYAPDLINATITNQKWDASWTAPPIAQGIGTGVTVYLNQNSILDGMGILRNDQVLQRRKKN